MSRKQWGHGYYTGQAAAMKSVETERFAMQWREEKREIARSWAFRKYRLRFLVFELPIIKIQSVVETKTVPSLSHVVAGVRSTILAISKTLRGTE